MLTLLFVYFRCCFFLAVTVSFGATDCLCALLNGNSYFIFVQLGVGIEIDHALLLLFGPYLSTALFYVMLSA